MYCGACGNAINAGDARCGSCGAPRAGSADPTTKMWGVLPTNTSWVAIVAGYLGLFAFVMFPAPLALIFGVAALVHLKRRPHLYGKGRAWFATVVGALFTVLLVLIFVVR